MQIMLDYFNGKVGREEISKPANGNQNLHEITSSNDNGVNSCKLCRIHSCHGYNVPTL
jgi:hypothetical protein